MSNIIIKFFPHFEIELVKRSNLSFAYTFQQTSLLVKI